MNSIENKYIRIPDDVEFLLDLCRDLIRLFKNKNPDKEVPININQIIKLRSIEKKMQEICT